MSMKQFFLIHRLGIFYYNLILLIIGRPPGPEMENSSDRECYSLAAGLGLGLVVLGKGSGPSGLGDPSIADTLQYYMVGGTKRPLTGKILFYKTNPICCPSQAISSLTIKAIDFGSFNMDIVLSSVFFF